MRVFVKFSLYVVSVIFLLVLTRCFFNSRLLPLFIPLVVSKGFPQNEDSPERFTSVRCIRQQKGSSLGVIGSNCLRSS